MTEFKKICFGDRCFQIAGIKPYGKETRENLDYFYLGLWFSSIIYQILILIAFFGDFIWLGKFLDRLVEPYSAVVGGYGGMRLFFIDSHGRIKLDKRNRKTRTGHRFVFYWWSIFILMGLWTIFYPHRLFIESPAGTALTIALLCTVIATGYQYGKYKINNKNSEN